ncbi:unnamed protein product [Cuscuta campestris]|uniref:SWIM-type domain-containing protein n=1 Tax=Cuscuta campestris TaxID=132261 RepID=A0A484NQN4_9ASTE|nr:unnamed protein product [Cuscuta campestris]
MITPNSGDFGGHQLLQHVLLTLRNTLTSFRGSAKAVTWKFIRAAKAATVRERNWYMKLLDEEDPAIQPYLARIGFSKWSRAANNRYSIMTSNNAESMNSVDASARVYPIAQLIDFIIVRMQKWFHERRSLANSTSSILTRHYEAKLNELHASSAVMSVRPSCEYEFQVLDTNGRAFVVNLRSRTCTCCEFQIDHFVCVHAVVAIRTRPSVSCYEFISKYYTTSEWIAAYEGIIHPLASRDSWVVPEITANIEI